MKILYPITMAGSGVDVYYRRLTKAMNSLEVNTKITFYTPKIAYFPLMIKLFPKQEKNYDIIHTNAELGIGCKVKDKPLILTVHIPFPQLCKAQYFSFTQKMFYRLLCWYAYKSMLEADWVIAISETTKRIIEEEFKISHIQTIYNGIDTNLFKPTPPSFSLYPGKTKLLFVGNLTKRKGVDLLPKIMEKLDDNYLLFYTTGLRTKENLPPSKKMVSLGKIPPLQQMSKVYNLYCDILLAPSRAEGAAPYSVLEAMACGKPVITSNYSAMKEMVDEEEGGFLCKMEKVEDYVEKIKLLGNDKELREKMGEHNRRKAVEKFDLIKMANEYKKVYQKFFIDYQKF